MAEKNQNRELCCTPAARVIKLTIEGLECECACCGATTEESCCESSRKRPCCADSEPESRECR